MFIIFIFYIFSFSILWWGYAGYIMFLYILFALYSPKTGKKEVERYPSITVLVPCFNEESIIGQKIENLLKVNYPRDKLEVIFLDGNSTDNTVSQIKAKIQSISYMHLVQTNTRGKIQQINHILPAIKSDIVVNTDADVLLKEDTLIQIVKEFLSDNMVGVVGAMVIPSNARSEEVQYWKTHNRQRILESRAYSSSIVIAPCYAFKNGLIAKFPEDVVADDVYLPFYANVIGYKAIYCQQALAWEMRTPLTLSEMFRHKFRKINAYITEVLRFVYQLPRLSLFWKTIFLTRTLQILGLPWFLMVFILLTIALISFQKYAIIVCCLVIAVASLIIAHLIIGSIGVPEDSHADNILTSLRVFVIINFLLILAGLTYPFYKQTSSYQKVMNK